MKDKDKLILLFNIYVGRVNPDDEYEYLYKVRNALDGFFDDSVKCFFAPTWDEDKPLIQAVTDFPVNGSDLILEMEKYLEEENYDELKERAKTLCEFVKEYKSEELKNE